MCAAGVARKCVFYLLRQYIHSLIILVVFTLQNISKCAIRAAQTLTGSHKWRRMAFAHFSPCTTNRLEFHPKNKGWPKTMRTRTNQYLIWPEFFSFAFSRAKRIHFQLSSIGCCPRGLSQMAVESCCTSVRRCSRLMARFSFSVRKEKINWTEKGQEKKIVCGNGKLGVKRTQGWKIN